MKAFKRYFHRVVLFSFEKTKSDKTLLFDSSLRGKGKSFQPGFSGFDTLGAFQLHLSF